MNTTRSVLAALLLATFASAQVADAVAQPAGYEQMVADWMAANRDYRAAIAAIQSGEEYQAAKEARDTAQMRALTSKVSGPDAAAFGKRALELAEQAGVAGAMPFYAFATSNFNDKDTTLAIVERVQAQHMASADLVPLLENAMALSRHLGADASRTFLQQVIDKNSNAQPRAWAMYWLATMLQRNRSATAEDKEHAASLLTEAEALAAGSELGDRIAAPRFEEQRLQVGMQAPDIVGEDIDGVAFKLSDYRGKVILLDYWGFW